MTDLSLQTLPDPHVDKRATRRRFTVADKLRILRDADQCTQHGQLGALLRRAALYASTLASFRKQYQEGKLAALYASVSLERFLLILLNIREVST